MLLSRIWSTSPSVWARCRLESIELSTINYRLIPPLTPGRLHYLLSSPFVRVCCLNHIHVGIRDWIYTSKAAVALLLLSVIAWTNLNFILSCNSSIESYSTWTNLSTIWCKQVFWHRLSLHYGSMSILLESSCLLSCNSTASPSLEIWPLDRTGNTSFKGHCINSSIQGIWKCVIIAFSKMGKPIGCKSILVTFELFFFFNRRQFFRTWS